MKPPKFVKLVGDIWTLSGDNSITVEIEACGRLDWDASFNALISRLQGVAYSGAVLDVGAYIGDSTRWFTQAGFRTYAFEAQRDAFLCLLRNCPEARCYNFPVGNGERVFLDATSDGNLGGRSLHGISVLPDAGTPTLRIDDLDFQDVSMIKIDVEGWEPYVLEGANETIERCKPLIVCEINPQALKGHGLTPEDIYKHLPGWSQEEVFRYYDQNWDILFSPP